MFSNSVYAQFFYGTQQDFRKNNISDNSTKWTSLTTPEFELIYKKTLNSDIKNISEIIKLSLSELTSYFNIPYPENLKFIYYKNKQEIYPHDNTVDYWHLEKKKNTIVLVKSENIKLQVEKKIAFTLLNSINSQSLLLLSNSSFQKYYNFPSWFKEGLFTYISAKNNYTIKEELLSKTDSISDFNFTSNNNANNNLLGFLFWNYLGEYYGDHVIPQTALLSYRTNNINNTLHAIFGKNLKRLRMDCLNYYSENYSIEFYKTKYTLNEKQESLKDYYLSHDLKYAVKIKSDDSSQTLIIQEIRNNKIDEVDLNTFSVLDNISLNPYILHTNNQLSFVCKQENVNSLYTLDLKNKNYEIIKLPKIENIRSFSISQNKNHIAISTSTDNNSIIYIYNKINKSFELRKPVSLQDIYITFSSNNRNLNITNLQGDKFSITLNDDFTYNKIEINNFNKKSTKILSSSPILEYKDSSIPELFKNSMYLDKLSLYLSPNQYNTDYQVFTGGPEFMNTGLNALFEITLSDIFNNYALTGGFRTNFQPVSGLSLSPNSEFKLRFDDRSKRWNKSYLFYRRSVFSPDVIEDRYALIRVITNKFEYKLTYPISPVSSVSGAIAYRRDKGIVLSIDDITLDMPIAYKDYATVRFDHTYDNTINYSVNLYRGFRAKTFVEMYQGLDGGQSTMINIGTDLRHYTRVHRNIIWANRVAVGTSLGSQKLAYYLGGVDYSFNPGFDYSLQPSPDINYGFQTLMTNMRGFNQNVRHGTSFALFNSELRIPVFQYFSKVPLNWSILRHFQVVPFFDTATAWTGSTPWSKENSLNIEIINIPPTKITLDKQKNPFVYGYGVGLRTQVFGYFIRADWAWGIDNGINLPEIFYLSLSQDF